MKEADAEVKVHNFKCFILLHMIMSPEITVQFTLKLPFYSNTI